MCSPKSISEDGVGVFHFPYIPGLLPSLPFLCSRRHFNISFFLFILFTGALCNALKPHRVVAHSCIRLHPGLGPFAFGRSAYTGLDGSRWNTLSPGYLYGS